LKKYRWREPYNSLLVYNFVKKEDVVLDIGANLGYFTLLCKNAKKIICVEPIPQVISVLKRNIKENNLKGKTKVIQGAVSRNKGKLFLEIQDSLNTSRIVKEKSKGVIEVSSYSLNDLVKKEKANFLRMDVEGYEHEILYDNIPKQVNKIAMEFHTEILTDKEMKDLLNYFGEEGFKVKYFLSDVPDKLHDYFNFLEKTGLSNLFKTIKEYIPIKKVFKLAKNRGDKLLMRLYKILTGRVGCVYLGLER
jgi:FkbM family methyltransferase